MNLKKLIGKEVLVGNSPNCTRKRTLLAVLPDSQIYRYVVEHPDTPQRFYAWSHCKPLKHKHNKPMTTKKFLKLKNALVLRVTGELLIPADQIVKTPRVTLMESSVLCGGNCPYCRLYITETSACTNCPMKLAGNSCHSNASTYTTAHQLWTKLATADDEQELIDLIRLYNQD